MAMVRLDHPDYGGLLVRIRLTALGVFRKGLLTQVRWIAGLGHCMLDAFRFGDNVDMISLHICLSNAAALKLLPASAETLLVTP